MLRPTKERYVSNQPYSFCILSLHLQDLNSNVDTVHAFAYLHTCIFIYFIYMNGLLLKASLSSSSDNPKINTIFIALLYPSTHSPYFPNSSYSPNLTTSIHIPTFQLPSPAIITRKVPHLSRNMSRIRVMHPSTSFPTTLFRGSYGSIWDQTVGSIDIQVYPPQPTNQNIDSGFPLLVFRCRGGTKTV